MCVCVCVFFFFFYVSFFALFVPCFVLVGLGGTLCAYNGTWWEQTATELRQSSLAHDIEVRFFLSTFNQSVEFLTSRLMILFMMEATMFYCRVHTAGVDDVVRVGVRVVAAYEFYMDICLYMYLPIVYIQQYCTYISIHMYTYIYIYICTATWSAPPETVRSCQAGGASKHLCPAPKVQAM